MVTKTSLLTLAAAGLASAHYRVTFPEWRGETLEDLPEDTNITQWLRPCAGIEYGSGNRTDWALSGGHVGLSLGHAYNFLYINLAIEEEGKADAFVHTLTPNPLNTTGHGTLCLSPQNLTMPSGLNLTAGTNASLQFVKVGDSGNSMYNCADIRFVDDDDYETPDSELCTTEDAEFFVIEPQSHDGDHGSHGGDGHGDGDGDDSSPEESGSGDGDSEEEEENNDNAAPASSAQMSVVLGLGIVLAVGLSL